MKEKEDKVRKNKDKKAESNPGEVHTKVRRRTDTARDDFVIDLHSTNEISK
jgi:hypothetical protein